jgi:hypothetical protein
MLEDPKNVAYGAFSRVGLGKLGYIGDVNFGEEPERLILAMCHLDRSFSDQSLSSESNRLNQVDRVREA